MRNLIFPIWWVFVLLLGTTAASILRTDYFSASESTGAVVKSRKLADKLADVPSIQTVSVKGSLDKQSKKLKFLKTIQGILSQAKERKLAIKSIQLGSDLKRVFDNQNLETELGMYVNDPHFDQKIAKLEQTVKRKQGLKKAKARQLQLRQNLGRKSRRLNPLLGGVTNVASAGKGGSAGGAGKGGNNMNFSFMPGFAGMPFPPLMMRGPNFHPPMNFTVNSIPNPNPRSALNPFEIEQSNLSKQVDSLKGIFGMLKSLTTDLKVIDEDVENKLDEKLQRVLEIH